MVVVVEWELIDGQMCKSDSNFDANSMHYRYLLSEKSHSQQFKSNGSMDKRAFAKVLPSRRRQQCNANANAKQLLFKKILLHLM